MAKYIGKDIMIYSGSTAVAACTQCDIETNCETIEVSGPDTGQSKEFVPGRKSWTAKASTIVVAVTDVLKAGTSVWIKFGKVVGYNLDKVEGKAIITRCNISSGRGIVRGSITFQGTGDLMLEKPQLPELS